MPSNTTIKDRVTNFAAGLAFVGSILGVGIESGVLSKEYQKYSLMLMGTSAVIVAFATGKSADLRSSDRTRG